MCWNFLAHCKDNDKQKKRKKTSNDSFVSFLESISIMIYDVCPNCVLQE